MKFRDLFGISCRFIWNSALESLMIILGLALAAGIMSNLFSLISAYTQEMKGKANDPHQREIRVEIKSSFFDRRFPVAKIGTISQEQFNLSLTDLNGAKRECPDVSYAYIESPERFDVTDEFLLDKAKIKDFEGRMITSGYFEAYGVRAAMGSVFTAADIKNANPVLVLGARLAKKLFPGQRPVGKKITLKTSCDRIRFSVIGILKYDENYRDLDDEPVSINNMAFCPFTLSSQYKFQKTIDALSFSVNNIDHLRSAVNQLTLYFSSTYKRNAVRVHSFLDRAEEQKKIITPVFFVISFFSASALFIAAINILNLMLARILRRSTNIGISIALGASRFDIFKLFFSETLILGCFGGIAGCFVTLGLSNILQIFLSPHNIKGGGPQLDMIKGAGSLIYTTWNTLAISILLTVITSLIFGIYPACGASKTEASNALRMR